jgi:hypothetical protein
LKAPSVGRTGLKAVAPGAKAASLSRPESFGARPVPAISVSKNSSTANAACPSGPPRNFEEKQMVTILAASIFHFGTYTVGDVKQFLKEKNISVRM